LALLPFTHANSVTTGATVTLNGTFFTDSGGYGPGIAAAPQDLVSGVFQPEQQQWNLDSAWWNGNDGPNNTIQIDLNGTFNITGFTVQADDNDTYEIDYLTPGNTWLAAWVIPPPGGYGLTTSSTTLGSAITATELRVEALNGDDLYAVSQVEAFGQAAGVPDLASTLGLFGSAIALLGSARRFRRR
jgi:hypothetical protein